MPSILSGLDNPQSLAQAIVNTIHEPLVVLDAELRVVAASRAFYAIFQVNREETFGRTLYSLGDGQWNIPALRLLLEDIIPERSEMDGFEVSHDFPGLGQRTMLLNARKVLYEASPDIAILLAFTDVTERRAIEKIRDELHERTGQLLLEKHTLMQEMEHRVANSLQIIASILMLKSRLVISEESRQHLKDAHQRVMSVATVQAHLHATDGVEEVEVERYLVKLCESLAISMIGDQPIRLQVVADKGKATSAQAVSLGLIVTELVINALKYAFPKDKPGSLVMVTYESKDADWKLIVSDNGVGDKSGKDVVHTKGGLGTVIVKALVKRLDARMELTSTPSGMTVAVTHATFTSNMPQAA